MSTVTNNFLNNLVNGLQNPGFWSSQKTVADRAIDELANILKTNDFSNFKDLNANDIVKIPLKGLDDSTATTLISHISKVFVSSHFNGSLCANFNQAIDQLPSSLKPYNLQRNVVEASNYVAKYGDLPQEQLKTILASSNINLYTIELVKNLLPAGTDIKEIIQICHDFLPTDLQTLQKPVREDGYESFPLLLQADCALLFQQVYSLNNLQEGEKEHPHYRSHILRDLHRIPKEERPDLVEKTKLFFTQPTSANEIISVLKQVRSIPVSERLDSIQKARQLLVENKPYAQSLLAKTLSRIPNGERTQFVQTIYPLSKGFVHVSVIDLLSKINFRNISPELYGKCVEIYNNQNNTDYQGNCKLDLIAPQDIIRVIDSIANDKKILEGNFWNNICALHPEVKENFYAYQMNQLNGEEAVESALWLIKTYPLHNTDKDHPIMKKATELFSKIPIYLQ